MATITAQVFEMIQAFLGVALTDPVSTVLVTFGFLFTTAAMVVFGWLALGGLLDWITPGPSGRGPPREV